MSKITTWISRTDHGRPLTVDEYLGAEFEEGPRYELGRGFLEVTEFPTDKHGHVVCNIITQIFLYDREHPDMILRAGGAAVSLVCLPGRASVRHPDFSVILRSTPKNPRKRCVPSIVGEIVSPRTLARDCWIKREEYLAAGILEYWIVDHLARRMTLLVRDGDVWVERKVEDGRPIPSVVLPGLAATTADLWLDLDEYGPDSEDD